MNETKVAQESRGHEMVMEDMEVTYLPVFGVGFYAFAVDCGLSPERLLQSIERAIRTRHSEAVSRFDIARDVWYLEAETVGFFYQVRGKTIVIGDIRSIESGQFYESTDDLLAEFEE